MANESEFLSRHFREYYSKNNVSLPSVEMREFGIGSFGKKIVKRHMSFPGETEMNSYLKKEAPLYISASNAYYLKPGARPMEAKEFAGADLIYEFDADDIPTKCKQDHDKWRCTECGKEGKGAVESCPKCGSQSISVEQWFCGKCIDATKQQTLSLVEVLENEIGIEGGITVNFSGNAGYHVYVRNDAIKGLSQKARVELVDYITLHEFDLTKNDFYADKIFHCPEKGGAKGAAFRVREFLKSMVESYSIEGIASLGGVRVKSIEKDFSDRKKVVQRMDVGILKSVAKDSKRNSKFWSSLVDFAVSNVSLKIDRQTSVDLRKIVRVPDTLHGSTGLLAKNIPIGSLKEFDPFTDATVFSPEPVRVSIKNVPSFNLNAQSFGPFKGETVEEMPLFAAVFLVGKGKAELVDSK